MDLAGALRQGVKKVVLNLNNYLRSSILNLIAFAINFKMAEKCLIEYYEDSEKDFK